MQCATYNVQHATRNLAALLGKSINQKLETFWRLSNILTPDDASDDDPISATWLRREGGAAGRGRSSGGRLITCSTLTVVANEPIDLRVPLADSHAWLARPIGSIRLPFLLHSRDSFIHSCIH